MCELCVSSVICVSYEVDVKMKSLSEVDSPLVVNAQGALPIDLILKKGSDAFRLRKYSSSKV